MTHGFLIFHRFGDYFTGEFFIGSAIISPGTGSRLAVRWFTFIAARKGAETLQPPMLSSTALVILSLQGYAAFAPGLSAGRLARSPLCRSNDPKLCGILAVSGSKKASSELRLETLTLQRHVRHRGPDGSGIHVMKNHDGSHSAIAHERLAIMDPLSGNQPLYSQDRKFSLAVNGEIYNYKELRKLVGDESKFRTGSDCEPIVHLYEQIGEEVVKKLDGDFALVIMNEADGSLFAARDPIGVNSLYWGTGLDGSTWFASEAKPLVRAGCIDIEMFPPGHYYSRCLPLTSFMRRIPPSICEWTGPSKYPQVSPSFMRLVPPSICCFTTPSV